MSCRTNKSRVGTQVLGDRAHKDRHLPLVQNADVCVAGEVGDTSKRRASSVHPLRSSSDNSKDVNTSYARAHRGTTERPKDTESRVSKQSPTTDKSRTFIKETGGQRRDIRDITVVVDDASSDYDGSSANDYDGSSGGSDDEGDDRMTTPDFALYPPCSYLNCLMVLSHAYIDCLVGLSIVGFDCLVGLSLV